MSRRLLGAALVTAVSLSLLVGCAKPNEVIVETAAGRRASNAEVDGDPWRLLPGGAITWARIDARALAQASFGPSVNKLVSEHLPLSEGRGIELSKDADEIILGVYATAGADVAAVARGRFDAEKLNAAIQARPVAAHDVPIRQTRFAGALVYVTGSWAMSLVTPKTLVFGTEIGVRRVLERIEEGRLQRALPKWYEDMLSVKKATIHLGVDLDAQPVPSVVRTKLAFLSGLRAGRLLGNFESPGLNFAGTLTYDQPASATKAAADIEAQGEALRRAEILLTVLKIPRPLRRLEARATGKETQVAVEVDGRALEVFFDRAEEMLGELVLDDSTDVARSESSDVAAPAAPAAAPASEPAP